jgi:hypothetical protein
MDKVKNMTQKDKGQNNTEANKTKESHHLSETPATKETPDTIRIKLEKDACEKSSHGDILEAINDIDKAMAVDQQWYHYIYKALWFIRLQNFPIAYTTLQTGLGHYQGKEFWFRYIYADMIYRQPSSANTIEEVKQRINIFNDAINAADTAYKTIEADKISTVEKDISEIPECFTSSGYINLNLTNLKFMVSGLLRDLKLSKSGLMTLDAIYATAALTNSKFVELEKKVESERIKTIELLGIFTAIISFVIITGTSTLKMGSFEVAMPILGGLALVLLALVSAVSLLTTRYTSLKDRVSDIKLWMFVFLVIIISCLIYYSVNKIAEQNNPIIPKISTETSVSSSIKSDDLLVAPGSTNKTIIDKDKDSKTQ